MIFIGIDPGLKGGLAVVDANGAPVSSIKLPYLARRVDTAAVVIHLGMDDCRVAVEQQNIRPAQQGARNLLANYGRLLGACELAGVPYHEVAPGVWNRAIGIPSGLSGRAKKEAAFEVATRLWGSAFTGLGLTPAQDGRVEALLIARWCWAA